MTAGSMDVSTEAADQSGLSDEAARLAAVRHYEILDTPPDGTFDQITALAAHAFGVPISVVSIVDEDRIWLKSHHGLEASEIPRSPGLCASAILTDGPYVLTDATLDPVALANPLVAGELGLRFYAAVPLRTTEGHNLGTLCVIDRKPRPVSEWEMTILAGLAQVVVREMELRLEARIAIRDMVAAVARAEAGEEQAESGRAEARARAIQAETALATAASAQAYSEDLARALQTALLPPSLPPIPGVELAACYRPADRGVVGGDFYDLFPLGRRAWGVVIGDVCGKGPGAASVSGAARYAVRAAAIDHPEPSQALRILNDTLLLGDGSVFCTVAFARLRPHGPDAFQLTVAAGGHPLPVVLRASGRVERLGEHGTIVGSLPEVSFTDRSARLHPGDAVVFFTDGITEARPGGEFFGIEGLIGVLSESAGLGAPELVSRIEGAVTGAGQTQRDDIAVVVLRISPAFSG